MHMSHLAGVDLNLLPLLSALLAERQLTRAARRVGLSQPAASRALARLRILLDDPLLVRTGASYTLTPRAEALREPVRRAVASVEAALAPQAAFEPANAERVLRVYADDYTSLVVLTPLIALLAERAPRMQLEVLPARSNALERLQRAEIDCCFTAATARVPRGLELDRLGDDGFVCMVSKKHPFARRAPDLPAFLRARHALIAPSGQRGGFVDDALKQVGERRHVSLLLPHFLVMPFAVASSDLVVTVAERLARVFAGQLPVAIFAPPIELPRFTIAGYWHERAADDPALVWLRAQTQSLGITAAVSGDYSRSTRQACGVTPEKRRKTRVK